MEYTLPKVEKPLISIAPSPTNPGFDRKISAYEFHWFNSDARQVVIECQVGYYLTGTNTPARDPGFKDNYLVKLTASDSWVQATGQYAGRIWSSEECQSHKAAVDAVNNFPVVHSAWVTEHSSWETNHAVWEALPEEARGEEPQEPIEPQEPVAPTNIPMEEYDFYVAVVGQNTQVPLPSLIEGIIQMRASQEDSKFNQIN